jgi:hypothetical protein
MQVQKNIGIDKIAYLVSGNNALLTTFRSLFIHFAIAK